MSIEHGFTDFEFENENIRVRLSKIGGCTGYPSSAGCCSTGSSAAAAPAAAQAERAAPAADPDAGLHKITSPIVGTFYRSPGPDKDPYVSEGSKVSPETIVCIVEAMKLMNEIQAEISARSLRSTSRTASRSSTVSPFWDKEIDVYRRDAETQRNSRTEFTFGFDFSAT